MNRKIMTIFPVVSGVLFFILGFIILMNGHLHEDAYILFQYSKNFSLGNGITFDSISGPLEGATDFLWMISIGLLSKVIGDIALSALLLNSIGLSVVIYSIIKIRATFDLVTLSLCLAVIFSGGVSAALGGFSTLAYAALYALLTISVINKNYISITILAIAISLFRPDGVILAFGALLSLLIFSERKDIFKFASCLLIVVVVGSIYFIWRWNYFNTILPLPLLVKQNTDSILEGLYPNLKALVLYSPLIFPIIYFFKKSNIRIYSVILLGPLLLFFALSFMHQSQNIGYRFQFVIIVSLLIQCAYVIPIIKGKILYLLALLPILADLRGAQVIYRDIKYLTNDDYINNFPQLLKKSNFNVEVLAITEAGRFPFWFNARKTIDLVGLNSRDVIFEGAERVLEKEKPELIFIHHAGRFTFKNISDDNAIILDLEQISINDYEGNNPVAMAPIAALKYAKENNYSIIAVRYGSNDAKYSHVYFINKTLDLNKFVKVLNESFYNKTTYFSSKSLLLD